MRPLPSALAALAGLAMLAGPCRSEAQGSSLRSPDMAEALHQLTRLNLAADELRQTVVVPERPGQNQVNWYDFEWHHFDIPSPSGGKGGVRLYFYSRERISAERALPAIRNAYLRLVDQFHYTPTKQIPYILYSSKREFQTTNLFEVSESVLGVTSPRDLKMSLPYFGDHEKFREVSTHEMVHQFTIQKMLDIAGADELHFIDNLPLWFVEGIAEYYSKGGLDSETDRYLRDLVWNPDAEHHYQILPFAEDRYRGYIATYKLGQARVAFIADVYGKEKIQALIENAYTPGGGSGRPDSTDRGFAGLVRRVLNEPVEQVDGRWRAWLKRRYYPEYMRVRQDLPQLREYTDLPAEPEAFTASPDGWLVAFRGLDRERGRAHLYLFDVRSPRAAVEVVSDDQPGVESLHPIEQNVLSLTADKLAFTAQAASTDALYVVPIHHQAPRPGKPARITLGSRRRVELRHPAGLRFIEVSDPAFSPDGKRIAFVALTDRGQRDIYVVDEAGGVARQLTDDPFAESDLAWGPGGIYFTSDATDHGLRNLFRLDEASGAVTRLTTAASDDRHPSPQADGSVLFTSHAGRPDIYRLQDGQVRRITDFATGLDSAALAPAGRGIFASTFYRGRFRLVEVSKVAFLDEPPAPVPQAAGPALDIPRDDIPESTPSYQPYTWENWHNDLAFITGAGGAGVFAGRAALLFSDLLRDQQVLLDASVYGSWDYVQGILLYSSRARRLHWITGAYINGGQQVDRTDFNLTFFQRDFGLAGVLQFPLDRFRRFELELHAGAVQRYCLTDFAGFTPNCSGVDPSFQTGRITTEEWRRLNAGINAETGATVRYGYETVRLDPYAGPISGSSLLLEVGNRWLPTRGALSGFARLDAASWVPIVGRTNFMLRASAGASFAPDATGRNWARAWWLSAADNLRGYTPLDVTDLVGLYYYVANAELHFPLDAIIRLFLFDNVEGVLALDFGGVFDDFSDQRDSAGDLLVPGAWRSRTLTGVLGANAHFGPLLLRIHFGHPYDIGGKVTPALANHSNWVTNVTLRYAFF